MSLVPDLFDAPAVMTVSELVLKASNALEAQFGTVAVEGELSSFRHVQSSGHMYWTLKDRAAQVECAMFRSDNRRLRLPLADGIHVVVVGRPTIYQVRGRFQIIVSDVLPQGRGALYLQFEALRERLAAEGLFAEERKRRLPFLPRVVGVVTSAEGAAVRDIVTVIRRRAPATRVWLKPVPVQGREAAAEIARAVRWFATRGEVEVLVVGRGGGSLEDLWAFNEEIVVRAIAESPIPVVSAVGHESDTTLADYVADLRAPTPSAAAERVVPETRHLARRTIDCFRRLAQAVERQRLRRVDDALAPIKRYGFRRVRDRLREAGQRRDEATRGMPLALAGRLDAAAVRWTRARSGLGARPRAGLEGARRRLVATRALARGTALRHERARRRHAHLVERLGASSPLAILKRGYAVVRGPDGRALTDADAVSAGDPLDIRLARGRVAADVRQTFSQQETG